MTKEEPEQLNLAMNEIQKVFATAAAFAAAFLSSLGAIATLMDSYEKKQ